MSRTSFRSTVAVSAILLLITALPAGADTTVEIDDVSAVAVDGTVTVDFDVDFAAAPIELVDDTGDSLMPSADIAGAEVEMISDRQAEFRVTLADPLPDVGTTTVTMVRWETDKLIATAMHNRYSAPGSWSFDLQRCGEGPAGNQCSSANTSGSYADGVITWRITFGTVGLGFGGTLLPDADGLHVTQTAAGLVWLNGLPIDALDHGFIDLPTLTITATNRSTGASVTDTPDRARGDVSLPGARGDVIDVEACLDGVCATSTTTAR